MKYQIYTLSSDNDFRFINLLCLLESNKLYDDADVKIIPFNDKNEITDYISNIYENSEVIKTNSNFDNIGKEIFGDIEYRKNIPNWRLFRKLNFLSHDAKDKYKLFLDSNSIIINNISKIKIRKEHENGYIFGSRSRAGRSLTDLGFSFCNILNENVQNAFNAGFMLTKQNFDNDVFYNNFDYKNLKKLINKAPEQGFLALYLSINKNLCMTLSETNKYYSPMLSGAKTDFTKENIHLGKENKLSNNRIPFTIKWSGQVNLDPTQTNNKFILEELLKKSIKRLLSHQNRDDYLNKSIINDINSFLGKELEI